MVASRRFTEHDVVIGRVLSEDSDHMIIEVGKHDSTEFTLEEGDVFYTLIFVDGKPWERSI